MYIYSATVLLCSPALLMHYTVTCYWHCEHEDLLFCMMTISWILSVMSVLDTNGYLQSIYFITQQHMRIHFATTLLTAMRKAHAKHNGSERYSTYRQHDSAFSGLCGIMKMDWPGIHSVASAHYSSSPWSVLPWRWKLYSPIKHEHLYSYVGSLLFLWTRETISLLGSVLHID